MSNKTNKEIERKFLINSIPEFKYGQSYKIEQGYLIKNNGDYTYRLRKAINIDTFKETYYQTIKFGDSIIRNEYEIILSKSQFYDLWELCEDVTISKYRYEFKKNNLKYFIDYIYDLNLYILEVEFDNIEDCNNFKPPSYVVEEVTNNKLYSNYRLALNMYNKKTQLLNDTECETKTKI
jgi:CYTH domain-containing protein